MVVAEVPLWAVHSSGGNRITENGSSSSSNNNTNSDNNVLDTTRANDSLSLLESLGGATKCAIYSVDMHPSGEKFATAGGDGAVRIWSTRPLFAKHRARFADNGRYVSSESSGGENTDGEGPVGSEKGEGDSNDASDNVPMTNGTDGARTEVATEKSFNNEDAKDGADNNSNAEPNGEKVGDGDGNGPQEDQMDVEKPTKEGETTTDTKNDTANDSSKSPMKERISFSISISSSNPSTAPYT